MTKTNRKPLNSTLEEMFPKEVVSNLPSEIKKLKKSDLVALSEHKNTSNTLKLTVSDIQTLNDVFSGYIKGEGALWEGDISCCCCAPCCCSEAATSITNSS